ncbi:MAG: hypothetical protein O8C66_04790 [Candidatus Methanoperedens sp.]|nr:hypothetical protein [Candidatus Methanoperedens sp.]MCZ7369805.1 hypothetical protein [Candidatus Methanoperedens sp.]
MEQAVECNNHPNKNAVRLCDDCGAPFCAECLRKNMLSFYYCQDCYPALFKNKTVPENEIPIDKRVLNKEEHDVQKIEDGVAPVSYIHKSRTGSIILIILPLLALIIFYIADFATWGGYIIDDSGLTSLGQYSARYDNTNLVFGMSFILTPLLLILEYTEYRIATAHSTEIARKYIKWTFFPGLLIVGLDLFSLSILKSFVEPSDPNIVFHFSGGLAFYFTMLTGGLYVFIGWVERKG